MNLWILFVTFLEISVLAFGGGYVAVPLMQSAIVEQHAWLTAREFADLVTIAEMTPGPIALNAATFVGFRVAGIGGALLATLGCILPSVVIVSLLFWLYRRCRALPFLQSVLKALRPIVVALIGSAGVTLLLTALLSLDQSAAAALLRSFDWRAALVAVAAFVLLRKKRLGPILAIAASGAAYCLLSLLPF